MFSMTLLYSTRVILRCLQNTFYNRSRVVQIIHNKRSLWPLTTLIEYYQSDTRVRNKLYCYNNMRFVLKRDNYNKMWTKERDKNQLLVQMIYCLGS